MLQPGHEAILQMTSEPLSHLENTSQHFYLNSHSVVNRFLVLALELHCVSLAALLARNKSSLINLFIHKIPQPFDFRCKDSETNLI